MRTTEELEAAMSLIYEQVAACIYDIEEGDPADALTALEDILKRLVQLGIEP